MRPKHVDDEQPRAASRSRPPPRRVPACRGEIGRADQARLALDEHQRLALIEGVIAERHGVDADGEEFLENGLGEAEAAGGILAIDDDEIEPPAGAQKGNLLRDGGASRPSDDVADEKQTDHRSLKRMVCSIGQDGVQPLIVRLIRHGGDFADPVGDADRMHGPDRAKAGQAPIVIAGAVADAVAAPVEAGERHEQKIRIDGGRRLEGLGNRHRPDARWGRPAAIDEK